MKKLIFLLLVSAVHSETVSPDVQAAIDAIFGKPPGNSSQPTRNVQVPGTEPEIGDNGRLPTRNVQVPTSQASSEHEALISGIHGPNEVIPCRSDDGTPGECVAYYLCNQNNSVITDGVGLINVRFGEDNPCGYLERCCKVPDKRSPDDPIRPHTENTEQRKGCGWRNKDGAGMRTIGDTDGETKFGEFPWMVAIIKTLPINKDEPQGLKYNMYLGGGSLIHQSVVLTTAHLVFKVEDMKVRSGEWDTRTAAELYPHQDRDVASKVMHKDFNKGNLFYDVALLFLAKPVDLAPNVGVVCLPPPMERTPTGTKCFATGWGKNKFGKEGRHQVILKKIEVPVVDHHACQSDLRRTRLGDLFQLHVSFMCAGGERDKDTCKGDGGSPLSCPIEFEQGRYMQSGIVAWGIGCGQDGTPGVYVDVARMRHWIDDQMAGQGYSTDVYNYNSVFSNQ